MNITSAQYIEETNEDGVTRTLGIQATIDGRKYSVPIEPANRHYAEIMRQVEAGELTIQAAD